jgi:ketosteroid isomerase-like protein
MSPANSVGMAHRFLAAFAPLLAVALTVDAPIPAALQKMAETERAFARRAQEATVRDAFIEFFADESIGFEPGPVPARESLRKRPPPTVRVQLLWEPRYGDVAKSGDLGYLTGPAETIPPGKPSSFGNYFSVWKRQAEGEYRVILDVGVTMPEKPRFAPGFTRAKGVPEWTGSESRGQSEGTLTDADTAFSHALAKGAPEAYQRVLHETARFMRNKVMPLTTRRDTVEWLNANVTSMTSTPEKAETAASGDLGYTWGPFTEERKDGTKQSGYYVRVWTRKADGQWQLVADITAPKA